MASLIIGASSTIAQAVIHQLLANGEDVIAISRKPPPSPEGLGVDVRQPQLQWQVCEQTEQAIEACVDALRSQEVLLDRVLIFLGVLHDEQFQPEKRIDDCSQQQLQWTFHVNTFLPLLWASALTPLLTSRTHRPLPRITFAVISARVGSIADNRLGGWYSYRASKSALNMAMKTASIELARRAPNIKLVAYHPGTTDTPLSEPFQQNVPADKLFSPEFAAAQMLDVTNKAPLDGQLSYLDWNHQTIQW